MLHDKKDDVIMKDYGLVSIVTPNWNCARYVKETILSVQAQTYTNWEMIIVDDCSTDNSIAEIESVAVDDSRIRLLCNEKNSGAAVSRNRALCEAKGRWVAFLDSDDQWEPCKLERQLCFMVDNSYCFSYTGYSEMDECGKARGVMVSGPRKIGKTGMYCYCWMGCLTVMYDREYFGLLQITPIKVNNDYAMWLHLCRKMDCYLLNETLARYRSGRGNSVSNKGLLTLIGWHYRLFRDVEGRGQLSSFVLTCVNMVCGVYKKLFYVKKA